MAVQHIDVRGFASGAELSLPIGHNPFPALGIWASIFVAVGSGPQSPVYSADISLLDLGIITGFSVSGNGVTGRY